MNKSKWNSHFCCKEPRGLGGRPPAEGPGGGPPAEGPPPPPWGPGGEGGGRPPRGPGVIDWGGAISKDYTKLRRTIQSPKRVYEDITY